MRVGAQVTEDDKAVAIVAVQTVLGAKPEEALGLLDNRAYHIVGETIGGGKVKEAHRGRPGPHLQRQAQGTSHQEYYDDEGKRATKIPPGHLSQPGKHSPYPTLLAGNKPERLRIPD